MFLKDGRGLEQKFPQWYSQVGAGLVVEHWEDDVVDEVVVRDVVGHIEVMVRVVVYVEVEVEHVDEGHVMVMNLELGDVDVVLEDEVVVNLELDGVEVVLEDEVVEDIDMVLEVVTGLPQRPALLMWSVSNVTAALSAMKEPLLDDPVVTVMAVRATRFPVKIVAVPMVAELPICQKTLQGRPPLIT